MKSEIRMETGTEKKEYLTAEVIDRFLGYLVGRGCSKGSLDTYQRCLTALYTYLPEPKELTADTSAQWREWLGEQGFSQRTVNNRVSVLNSLLEYLEHRDWQSKNLSMPPDDVQPELTRAEYLRLLSAARLLEKKKTYLLVKTLGGAGLRLQELPQLTVEAVSRGTVRLDYHNQVSSRVLHLPRLLREELLAYCQEEHILSGPVFVTNSGKLMNRAVIQKCISVLASAARVDEAKANPRCLWKMYQSTQEGIQNSLRVLAEQTYERMLETEQLTVGWDA